MTDFVQAFQNNQNNISEAVQGFKLFRPIVKKSQDFFMLYSKIRIK